MKKRFCRGLLSLALTGIALLAYAQNPLKIGDALPKQFWETPLQMVNTPQKTTTLAADKDKLILLDFWATWCSACLINFPKMEKLQEQFGDKVKILAVTDQDRATITKFMTSKNGERFKNIPSVVEDKLLSSMFPHSGIPFVIWLKDGKVINNTDAEQVTAKTLQEIVSGDTSSLQTVIQRNRDTPLFLEKEFDQQKGVEMLSYSILTRGYIRGISAGWAHRKNRDGVIQGRQFTNLSLNDIYYALAAEIFQQKFKEVFNDKRVVIKSKDRHEIIPLSDSDGVPEADKMYSYEMIVPAKDMDSLYSYMLQGLNRDTNFTATIEKRKIKCLRLVRTASQDRIATKGGSRVSAFYQNPSVLRNAPLQHMINMLNGDNTITDLPVVDETGYTGNVDITMPAVSNLAALRKELSRYGLDLLEGEQLLNMLVVRDRNQPNHL